MGGKARKSTSYTPPINPTYIDKHKWVTCSASHDLFPLCDIIEYVDMAILHPTTRQTWINTSLF